MHRTRLLYSSFFAGLLFLATAAMGDSLFVEGTIRPFRSADSYSGPPMREIDVDASALDRTFEVSVEGVTYRDLHAVREPDRDTFRFEVRGAKGLSTLTRSGQKIAGYLVTPEGNYAIYPLFGSTHLLVPDPQSPIECETSRIAGEGAPVPHGRHRPAASGPTPATVEVTLGVWYHPRLEAFFGSEENTRLVVQSLGDVENTALEATGNTFTKVTLVLAERIDAATERSAGRPDYSTPLEATSALSRFEDDRYVQATRYEKQVSLAAYIDYIGPIGTGCASVYTNDPTFWVNGTAALTWSEGGYGTFVHELGHTLGLNHEVTNAPAGMRPYSYAFINCAKEVRDVMSSGGVCFAYRQLFYSNPLHEVEGMPFGEPESSDAARRIREVAPAARDFWQHAMPRWPSP